MPFRHKPGFSEGRFWEKVSPEPNSGCYLWTGAVSGFGHGTVRIRNINKKAHRVAWEWANGPIPEGLCVLHRCDQPACVRVDHLFLGTKADNTADMVSKGRNKCATRLGEDSPNSKLTNRDVRRIRRLLASAPKGRGRYLRGGPTQHSLSEEYGVAQSLIGQIVRREAWTHLS